MSQKEADAGGNLAELSFSVTAITVGLLAPTAELSLTVFIQGIAVSHHLS